jgi:hypothetical protein
MAELEVIQKAFPVEIRGEINSLLTKFAVETKYATHRGESVAIGEEKIEIPDRIYYNPPYSLTNSKFTQKEKEILNCIFLFLENGYIRQKAIQNIICSSNSWTIPYIVRIIGEYIVEILNDINNNFEIINKSNLISFARQNPEFYNRTRARINSYWDCYFRQQFPEIVKGIRVSEEQRYVGFRLLTKIDKLINDNIN